MEGSISVKSKLGKGTEFTILLPIKHVSTEENMTKASSAVNPPISNIPASITSSKLLVSSKIETGENSNNSKPRILLVEDNPDVVAYIASCLQQDYTIYFGNDGQEGIDIALESIPDLIITDVMMPLKDGYELCKTLKADELTSHIPIIILTAKVDLESRLEGLEKGADAYLDKPFHKKELIIRIQNLLELRQNLQRHFLSVAGLSKSVPSSISSSELVLKENVFIQKVTAIVEKHLEDLEFSVKQFCKEIGMSRSQLHRKISALTGLSPNKFIRHIRLGKAKALLQNSELTINTIAYKTGFNGQNYFGRIFKSEFGMTPMEWRRSEMEEM
jgi:DNA-binding response OmpR family regulator